MLRIRILDTNFGRMRSKQNPIIKTMEMKTTSFFTVIIIIIIWIGSSDAIKQSNRAARVRVYVLIFLSARKK